MCFVVFCGVLCFVFCGCFVVCCVCFVKNGVLRCFCVCFATFWTCFANVLCGHLTFSEWEKDAQHRIALYCTKPKRILFVLCVLYILLVCFVQFEKNAKNTHTKHRKTPQNTAKHRKTLCFWKTSTVLLRDPLRVRDPPPPVIYNLRVCYITVCCVLLCAFATDRTSNVFWEKTPKARSTYCGCIMSVLFFLVRFACVLQCCATKFRKTHVVAVLRFASVLRCFAVFCRYFVRGVFCNTTEYTVWHSRDFWLLENARNTQAYCNSFVFSSVFADVFRVFCVICRNTAKHSQNTRKTPVKYHKTPAKHHKTPQNTFANKTANSSPHLLTNWPSPHPWWQQWWVIIIRVNSTIQKNTNTTTNTTGISDFLWYVCRY